ncbi:MAG: RagB/SusD family nutrient uptake outer membrane protein [Chitinophagales bacterium]|nr:RagB/SusD family nutrient uptake outer membrane protein [Chitinophagales bacterium]
MKNLCSLCGKTFFLSFFILTILISFSSCKKFLSKTSPNDVADENMFQDAASLESARIGLYNTLQDVNYYGGYFPLMVDAHSDNGQTGGYDSPALDELGNKTLTSSNLYIENTWIEIYNTIYTANQIIEHVDGIEDPTLSDELRNDIHGEALTIRALAHFDLLRMFGEHWDLTSTYGIPIVDHIATPEEIIGRSTVSATYDFIIGDLTAALDLVSNDDYRYDPVVPKGHQYITNDAVKALLARVYQYKKDYANASEFASEVINSGNFSLASNVSDVYTTKLSSESIFELTFSSLDRSQYNAATYARPDALRSEVLFLANENLKEFFAQPDRTNDSRAALVDFVNNDLSIEPDGRTQKYRGEDFQDNSAYIIRLPEMFLIEAEGSSFYPPPESINILRMARGLPAYTPQDVFDGNEVINERRAELNFEGHRFFDLAHWGKVQEVLGADVKSVFPIPLREVTASGGVLEQYPGY